MFEIYTKEVEIKEPSGNVVKYKLRPLNGRFLPKLYSVINVMQKANEINKDLPDEERNAKALESFDEDTVGKLHTLIFETLKSSYPKEDDKQLSEFASQNLMSFIGALIEVNIGNGNE